MRFKQSRAVRTFTLPEVKDVVNTISPDLEAIVDYETNIVNWLSSIIDLSNFNVYPVNGITEGLNYWMLNEKRKIYMNDNDYVWVPNNKEGDILYMSTPSAIDGNHKTIPDDVPVALDLAYIGSADVKKIDIKDNIEVVFFSLSKCFGLRNIRTGWFFSRKKIPYLHTLIYNAKYYNYYSHKVAEAVIDNFSVDYVYNKLRPYQINICESLNIKPSDVVWLGGEDRVCISKEISAAYDSSFTS